MQYKSKIQKFGGNQMINIIGVLLIILGISALYCVNYGKSFGIAIMAIFVVLDAWGIVSGVHNVMWVYRIMMAGNLIFIFAELVGIVKHNYTMVYIPQIYCAILGFAILIIHVQSENITIKVFTFVGIMIGFFVTGVLSLTAILPDTFIRIVGKASRNDAKAEYEVSDLDNGGKLHSNVHYGDNYPLSEMDIYVANEIDAPLFFYIHGGGFAAGDKVEGDPNAKETGFLWYFYQLMEAGYNIVSVNYALAPEYKYPTPIYQISEAVSFLKIHGNKYGVDTQKLVFSGTSAGGNLAGQFVNIQTNKTYAEEMGIEPVLDKENIKAVVFSSSLLDNSRFGKSDNGSLILDYLWFQSGRAYLKAGYLDKNDYVEQSNVISHVTKNFPHTYISDANTGSFLNQAKELQNRLDELGVENTYHFIELSEGSTSHGYETSNTEFGRRNMMCLLEFLRKEI